MITIKEVREELWNLWIPAKARGDARPPDSRITFSRKGWMELLSDPEIRQYHLTLPPEIGMETVLGARIVIDRKRDDSNAQRFTVELMAVTDGPS